MMRIPPPDPRAAQLAAEIKIKEQERKTDLNLSWGYPSNTAQSQRLSRRAYVLIQLTIIVLLIIGLVVFYHIVL
jgi:hypothetical protein